MAERKRAEAVGFADGLGSASFGNVADFDPNAASPGASPANAALQAVTSGTSSQDTSPRASYAARRASIVPGVSQRELLFQHRRSLAGLVPAPDAAATESGVDVEGLEGVTLSRRHTISKQEYDEARQADMFAKLDGFKSGFDDEDDTEQKKRDSDDEDDGPFADA